MPMAQELCNQHSVALRDLKTEQMLLVNKLNTSTEICRDTQEGVARVEKMLDRIVDTTGEISNVVTEVRIEQAAQKQRINELQNSHAELIKERDQVRGLLWKWGPRTVLGALAFGAGANAKAVYTYLLRFL